MGSKEDEEEESEKNFVGRTVRKHFAGFGYFLGKVVSYNRARKFYKVKYADGDREELDLSELKEILFHNDPQVVLDNVEEKSKGKDDLNTFGEKSEWKDGSAAIDEKPKGTVGRKRKRDSPQKLVNRAVGGAGPAKSKSSIKKPGSDSIQKPKVEAGRPPERGGVVVNEGETQQRSNESVPQGVEEHNGQPGESPLRSSNVNFLESNDIADNTTENPVEDKGRKRAGACPSPAPETSRVDLPKRARVVSCHAAGQPQLDAPENAANSVHLLEDIASGLGGNSSSATGMPPHSVCPEETSKSGVGFQITSTSADFQGQRWCPGDGLAKDLRLLGSPISTGCQPTTSANADIPIIKSGLGTSSISTDVLLHSASSGFVADAEDRQNGIGGAKKEDVIGEIPASPETIANNLSEDRKFMRDAPRYTAHSLTTTEAKAAALPLPTSATCFRSFDNCAADLFQVYSVLRSFSLVFFLSPFALEEFVVALTSTEASPMLDCVHVSLLQALRRHLERLSRSGSNSATFSLRLSDWTLLDNITWPSFLMGFLLTQGFTSEHGQSFAEAGHSTVEYYKLPASTKLAFLSFLCDKALETDEARTELDRRAICEGEVELNEIKGLPPKRPHRTRRDSLCLEGEFEEEFERMTRQRRESPAMKGGMEALAHSKSMQSGGVRLEQGEDGNLDECVLCGMDGSLICCDGCPAAYHARCVGVTRQGLPPGDWFCPECRANKLDRKGITIPKGLRGAELLFIDPYGRLYFSSCGYLLISESGTDRQTMSRYYSPRDSDKVVKFLEDAGPIFADLLSAVKQLWQLEIQPIPGADNERSLAEPCFTPVSFQLEDDVNQLLAGSHATGGFTWIGDIHTLSIPEPPSGDIACGTGAIGTDDSNQRPGSTSRLPIAEQEVNFNARSDITLSEIGGSQPMAPLTDTKVVYGEVPDVHASREKVKLSSVPLETQEAVLFQAESTRETNAQPQNILIKGGDVRGISTQNCVSDRFNECIHLPEALNEKWVSKSGAATVLQHGESTPVGTCASGAFQSPRQLTAQMADCGRNKDKRDMGSRCLTREQEDSLSMLTQINAFSYTNKYTNGDIVFTAATYLLVLSGGSDDGTDEKGGSQKKAKPPSAADQLKAFSLAVPHFFWPSLKKRNMETPKEKCGWCISCRTPHRRGCLLTQVAGQVAGGAAAVAGGIKPIKGVSGHYSAVAAYILYMEENLHGLLGGQWEMPGYRKIWRKKVEQAKSVLDMKNALQEMESSLRMVALSSDWEKVVEEAPPLVSKYVINIIGAGAGSKKAAPKKRGRPPLFPKPPVVSAYNGACFGVNWWRGGRLSRQLYNWESLPQAALRRAGRQGGLKEIAELVYNRSSDLPRKTQQCAWRARTEKVSSIAQLAVQVRYLDRSIKWNEIVSPVEASTTHNSKVSVDTSSIKNGEIRAKSEEGGTVKYLLYFSKDGEVSAPDQELSEPPIKSGSSSSGYCTNKKDQGASKGEVWTAEKDVPLFMLKEYELKVRSANQSKLTKSVKARKVQTPAVVKKDSFWKMLCSPLLFASHETKRLSSWICGHCHLSCSESQSLQCQRCSGKFHKNCTQVEDAIDGREKVAVCKSCVKLRLGQRKRKPSYKMLVMQSELAEGLGVVSSRGVAMDVAEEAAANGWADSKFTTKKKDIVSGVENTLEGAQPGRNMAVGKNSLPPDPVHSETIGKKRKGRPPGKSRLQQEVVQSGKGRPGRKKKSLVSSPSQGVPELDTTPKERRTSDRLRNSLSPTASLRHSSPGEDYTPKGKSKLRRSLENQLLLTPNVPPDDDNTSSVKRRVVTRRERLLADGDKSVEEEDGSHLEKKRSPVKRKRLKIIFAGLSSEDGSNNGAQVGPEKRKSGSGLDYGYKSVKSEADIQRFRQERLLLPGQEGGDPSTAPTCPLCSEGFNPRHHYISCEHCKVWYHGDAVGVKQEDAPFLVGFKCHKCRKCRAPICPFTGRCQGPIPVKPRRRGGNVDHGEVIDAENVNRRDHLKATEKVFSGFNDVKAFPDFAAATDQAEQALAVDGSNFGHVLPPNFNLSNGLMCDLDLSGEHQLELTTPLSLGEQNINLWPSNGSGPLDLPGDFSSQADLASRAVPSLSFTELLASEDDYFEGVAGSGMAPNASWTAEMYNLDGGAIAPVPSTDEIAGFVGLGSGSVPDKMP